MTKPTIALFTGDPAGIGPELVARLLADGSVAKRANVLLVGSREVLEDGMRVARCRFDFVEGPGDAGGRDLERPVLVSSPLVEEGGFARGVVSARSGRHMLDGLAHGIALCSGGHAQALCFAPLNKG
ncbi:MAG TPA: hypothetical protein VFV55_09755, partial [Usitatibacteraceae bacterium]|nr:hypothetical protein [Usitatibacteraceae bacterium]